MNSTIKMAALGSLQAGRVPTSHAHRTACNSSPLLTLRWALLAVVGGEDVAEERAPFVILSLKGVTVVQ